MKIHLFWLSIIGVIFAIKAFPSQFVEDKGISATLERSTDILDKEIYDTMEMLSISASSNPKYAGYYHSAKNYAEVFDEIQSELDSADSFNKLQMCHRRYAEDVLKNKNLYQCDTSRYDDFKAYYNTHLSCNTLNASLPSHQSKLLLTYEITLQNYYLSLYFLDIMGCCGCSPPPNIKFDMPERNIAIECGTHWSRKYGE
jgi:hypothetical protein